ncbi:MAG: IS1634 family transposase [Chlamydiia bacterium]|nr:IS1634 family transposase [Chlamydiia bacterium]
MFIKRTTKKDRITGKTYCAYHLVESVRTERGPRQRIILYMGANIGLPEDEHPQLAQCISDILTNEQRLIPHETHIQRLAQQYVSQIVHRLSTSESDAKQKTNATPEFAAVDVNSIEQSEPRSVGAEHLILQMARQLKLPEQLEKLGLSKTETAEALGSIIGRAVNPDSERSTYAWLSKESGLGELLDFNFRKSSLDRLYRISDQLLPLKEILERYFEDTEQQFHGYASTIALYDLTNTYMEGQAKANPKARFGISKEKRNDCRLVTLGLVMNEHGFLHRTSVLPGNAAEPSTLGEMIQNLSVHQTLFKPTIILDAGIATEANLAWLRKHQYFYVVSARQNAHSLELDGELVPVGDAQDVVKAALLKSSDDSEEKWLYCESEAKAAVASKMKQSFKRRFEEELQNAAASLLKPKGRKKYTKVLERIGRLKEKHKKISGCYEINVEASEDGKLATAITWKALEEKLSDKLTGKYFLRSNRVNCGVRELWQIYNTLRNVEDAFQFMKSSLGLRPVYHQKERRVDGHLWITVMAYHLIQHCLYQLKQQNIHYNWETVRKMIRSRIRVTTKAILEDGKTLHHRSSTKAEGEQLDLYFALGLSSQILGPRKIIL